ncbi:MAG: hypothetical protein JWR09_794 [Mucilaginibacter sp.]|nr:hypothetical protein [Mucilaginibacter sp.]
MIITITKDTTKKEIAELLKKLPASNKKSLRSFYGKLKGAFGDGMQYQEKMR